MKCSTWAFKEELNSILEFVPENRRTLLFSATMQREVAAIASNYMSNPTEITVGTKNSGAENVKHQYYTVHASDRYLALKRICGLLPGHIWYNLLPYTSGNQRCCRKANERRL